MKTVCCWKCKRFLKQPPAQQIHIRPFLCLSSSFNVQTQNKTCKKQSNLIKNISAISALHGRLWFCSQLQQLRRSIPLSFGCSLGSKNNQTQQMLQRHKSTQFKSRQTDKFRCVKGATAAYRCLESYRCEKRGGESKCRCFCPGSAATSCCCFSGLCSGACAPSPPACRQSPPTRSSGWRGSSSADTAAHPEPPCSDRSALPGSQTPSCTSATKRNQRKKSWLAYHPDSSDTSQHLSLSTGRPGGIYWS